MTPIRSLHPSHSLIVVIDALDECDTKESIEVIETLAKIAHESPPFVRFLITGRADDDLDGIVLYHSKKACRLDLGTFPPDRDVLCAFYKKRFEELYDKNLRIMTTARLKKPWPAIPDLHKLAVLSNGLFIHAATTVKFVGDFKTEIDTPTKRLEKAVDSRHDGLDDLYRQVLQDAPNHADERFARVMGTLLLLRDPLSVDDLACLLRLGAADILISLTGCRSILRIPDGGDDAMTFFHASLRDFLLDEKRAGPHYIDSTQYHISILDDCVQIMTKEWDQETMRTRDNWNAGRALVYACNNWHYHLGEILRDDRWTGQPDLPRPRINKQSLEILRNFLKKVGANWFEMWASIAEKDDDMWRTLKQDLIILCDVVKARNPAQSQMHDLLHKLATKIEALSQSLQHEDISVGSAVDMAGQTNV